MNYREQLKRAKAAKNNLVYTRNKYGLYNPLQIAKYRMKEEYLENQIDRLTDLAIKETISSKLNNIGVDISIDGDKITDAIVKTLVKDIKK